MKIMVSQRGMFIGGKPACPKCGRRPRKEIPAGTKAHAQGRRFYGYCGPCAQEGEYERRQSLMRLSPEERELILELREAQPTGRHHAGLSVDHYARCVRWCMWNWSFYLALLGVVMLTGARFG